MSTSLKIRGLKSVLLVFTTIVLLYCFIFNPPLVFLPVGITKIIYVLAFPFFMLSAVNKLYWRKFKSVTILMLVYIFYTFLVHIGFSSQTQFFQRSCLMLFESFFTAYVIAYYLVKYFKDKADLIILWTAIVASAISTLLVMRPDLRMAANELFPLPNEERLQFLLTFRGFGIADDLLFSYSIALSVGLCICMKYARNNMLYYIFIVLFFFGIFFNARIGMVPILIYLIFIVVLEHKFSLLMRLSIVAILLVFLFKNSGILGEHTNTMEWLMDGGNEISFLLKGETGEKLGTFDALSKMLIVPDTLFGLIFGTGENIYLAKNNSDIGYILQLNYGGIIQVLLFLFIVIALYRKLKKNVSSENRWFCMVFIGTFLICNVKGLFFSTISGIRMLMLLFFVYTLSRKKVNANI